QGSAVGPSNDRGTAEGAVRAPAQRRQLVAELMIRGPDVIEELDLHDGLQAAGREPDRPAHDVRLGERRVVHAVAPELALQPPGDLEDAALALHLREVLLAAGVGDVL